MPTKKVMPFPMECMRTTFVVENRKVREERCQEISYVRYILFNYCNFFSIYPTKGGKKIEENLIIY